METVSKHGTPRRKWVPKAAKTSGGGQNEALDCLVYAVAISKRVNVVDPATPQPMSPAEEAARLNKLSEKWR